MVRRESGPPLWTIVEEEMESNGLGMTPEAEGLLRDLVGHGEDELLERSEGHVERREELESQAEANLRSILGETVNETRRRQVVVVHETTLQVVLRRICPLFPFC